MIALLPLLVALGANKVRSFEPQLASPESFAETFSIIADLDDGTYIQVQVAVTNAGFGSGKGGCRLVILAPGQKAFAARASLSREEWSYKAPTNTLDMGPCKLTGDDKLTQVQAELDGGGVVLEIAAAAQKLVTPASGIKIGDAFYDLDLVVPWAKVNATVMLPNQAPRQVAGVSFSDHSRATTVPKELARGWVRFRGLKGACPTLLLVRIPPNSTPEGWFFTPAQAAPERLSNVTVTQPPREAPKPFTVTNPAHSFTLTPERELYRNRPLDEFGLAGKTASMWVGDVLNVTLRGELDTGPLCGKVRGLMELTYIN